MRRVILILAKHKFPTIDDGKIVDKGSHNELVERCNIYREIVETQSDNMEVGI